ncbi:hypothetical protein [Methanobacterium spitsbergense]|uniref:Uncharacterized protein n=1 Tax=Methanobacterium spitsbergense TaxID=2874285 RepID=A0A8T5UVC8_9EURY|nr:hypothetical protein [Methanobacterium spitsbergense]MBZ2166187.1 hypothetical protein [Methanobacterium spitsbergense]
MLKFDEYEIKVNKPFATDMVIKFVDNGVNREQYRFISNRLHNQNLYLDNEYSMTSEIEYNESLQTLSIEVTIIIPNRIMPKDADKTKEIFIIHINRFQKFYERINQSLNYRKTKKLNINRFNSQNNGSQM